MAALNNRFGRKEPPIPVDQPTNQMAAKTMRPYFMGWLVIFID